jgi:hypothetical protein
MVFIFFTHDESVSFGDGDQLSVQLSMSVHPCGDAYDDPQQIRKVRQES